MRTTPLTPKDVHVRRNRSVRAESDDWDPDPDRSGQPSQGDCHPNRQEEGVSGQSCRTGSDPPPGSRTGAGDLSSRETRASVTCTNEGPGRSTRTTTYCSSNTRCIGPSTGGSEEVCDGSSGVIEYPGHS